MFPGNIIWFNELSFKALSHLKMYFDFFLNITGKLTLSFQWFWIKLWFLTFFSQVVSTTLTCSSSSALWTKREDVTRQKQTKQRILGARRRLAQCLHTAHPDCERLLKGWTFILDSTVTRACVRMWKKQNTQQDQAHEREWKTVFWDFSALFSFEPFATVSVVKSTQKSESRKSKLVLLSSLIIFLITGIVVLLLVSPNNFEDKVMYNRVYEYRRTC